MKKLNTFLNSTKSSTISHEEFLDMLFSLLTYKKLSEDNTIEMRENNRFNDWLELGSDFSNDNVTTSIHALLRLNPEINEEEFNTIRTSTQKLGETTRQVSSIFSKSIWIIKDIPNNTPKNKLLKLSWIPNLTNS